MNNSLAPLRPKLFSVAQSRIPKPLKDFVRASGKTYEYSRRDLRLIGYVSLSIPACYVTDVIAGQSNFDTFLLRSIIFILTVPYWFVSTRPRPETSLFPVYFVLVATLALPFMFGFMLIVNAALAPVGTNIESLWLIQYLIACFIFIQFANNGYLASGLWVFSVLLSAVPILFIEDPNYEELQRVIIYPFTCYATALAFGILTNRNADYIHAEKLKAASAIGSYIAHELRTPLASIRSRARFSASALGREASRSLDESGSHDRRPSTDLDRSVESLKVIQEEVEYANTLIDMLLLNTKDSLLPDNAGEESLASDIVKESVRRYPFSNSRERESVSIDVVEDFAVKGERLLVVHVVFNLLKNAVLFMQRKPDGRTEIRVLVEGKRGVIEVTDTGPGIPPLIRKRIFERFFTTLESGRGTGIGLSFCKMVMEGLGGEITVDSREGEFTTFRLLFPIAARS